MAEYNRFVSYVYTYENNQKTLNNGFVRVETIDERCKVYIHMKDLYGSPQNDLSVYMVRRYHGKLQGISLGIMKREGNQGEFFHETQKDNIENSGISLGEIAGIVIVSGRGQKYGTCWDDDLLDMYRFEPYERNKTDQKEKMHDVSGKMHDVKEKINDVKEQINDVKEQINDVSEENDLLNEVLNHEPKFIAMPASEIEVVEDLLVPPKDMEVSENIAMAASVSLSEAALTAAPLMGNMAGKKLSLEEKLDKILSQGIKMYPFEDDQVVSCIRFELQDIGMMPMKFWSYVSNSFLLSNYYSYRHLILGKFENGKYFLGVPGMGQQKDRFMAQLFGFKEFKAIRESEDGQSDFGYWYVVLN